MRTMIPRIALLAAVSFPLCQAATPWAGKQPHPTIWQVDRILVRSEDPRRLFNFLSEKLQLPVAWPITANSGFLSGGVGAGNVNIEAFCPPTSNETREGDHARARFAGLALEPYPLDECLPELRSRGILYNPPEPHVSDLPDGSRGTLWTTVVLPEYSHPEISVFLYKYSPAYLREEIKRKQLAGQLALKGGGPLGIRSVKEIVIGTGNLRRDRALWQKLLMPVVPSAPGLVQSGAGPAIHLVSSPTDRILRIVMRVNSLERARMYLATNHLLGEAREGEISLSAASLDGLSIRLVDK